MDDISRCGSRRSACMAPSGDRLRSLGVDPRNDYRAGHLGERLRVRSCYLSWSDVDAYAIRGMRKSQRSALCAKSTTRVMIVEPHYSLAQAVQRFFPDGPITVSTLRNAIRDGHLQATKPQGKLLVTESWLWEWLQKCR